MGDSGRRGSALSWPNPVLVRREVPPGRRVIAVSDVHGNLAVFRGLMEKVSLTPQDVLVLLGDMLEKGPDSLPLLRHLMALENTHTLWPVCGNCDGLALRFFEGDEWDEGFFRRYLPRNPQSVLRQMAAEISFYDLENLPALRRALREAFYPEWQWLRRLPAIIETREMVFVHGGVPSLDDLEGQNPWACMKNDNFLGQGRFFSKYVVVGHWPVTLYRPQLPSAAPLVSRARRILSIDGGCVLKLDGQLNALLFPDGKPDSALWTSFDGLPTAVALEGQAASERPVNIRWGRSRVEVLTEGEEFSLCRHLETGRQLPILTRFLHRGRDGVWCEDATDYRLPVEPGDTLSLSEVVAGGYLAKKDGVTGWYWGRLAQGT